MNHKTQIKILKSIKRIKMIITNLKIKTKKQRFNKNSRIQRKK